MRLKDFYSLVFVCGGKKKLLLGLMMKRCSHSRVAIFSRLSPIFSFSLILKLANFSIFLLALNCIIFKECWITGKSIMLRQLVVLYALFSRSLSFVGFFFYSFCVSRQTRGFLFFYMACLPLGGWILERENWCMNYFFVIYGAI